eukprot:695570-Amphidinium_carterae.1
MTPRFLHSWNNYCKPCLVFPEVDPAEDFVSKLKAKDYAGAITVLEGMVTAIEGTEDESYKVTWGKSVWGQALAEAWPKLLTEEARSPRVCYFHAGTGSGKTHALLQAASAWQEKEELTTGQVHSLYVTYNMNQNLDLDQNADTRELAICIRLVLRVQGCSNAKCAPILRMLAKHSTAGQEEKLRSLAAHAIFQKWGAIRVLLAVDECNLLSRQTINIVASALGRIALQLKTKDMKCLVIMIAMTQASFSEALSSDSMLPLNYALPDLEAQDVVMEDILEPGEITERAQALVRTWGGYHFRSLVCACLLVKKFRDHVSFPLVLADTRERLAGKVEPEDAEALRRYVERCVSVGVPTAEAEQPHAQKYLSIGKAVPPVLVAFVYEAMAGFASLGHPAQKIFESSCFTDPAKQLELCGMHFDQFRALHRLPVVPKTMDVGNSETVASLEWYQNLKFPVAVAKNVAVASFFQTEEVLEEGVKKKKTARTAEIPERGKYYHPGAVEHPWVDRLCVAQNGDAMCLVLYQDKLNKSLPEAVEALNAAAELFKKEGWKVLCVAHVVGASACTTKQKDFLHPYMLVRGSELETFYTPSFSPAVHFLKARHSIASGSGG